ncbi:hypothetical protein EDD17DRAFT_1604787 [Pisolithus thermaeus]|nr:hypothetical protein EDD17DRAFT_1604787 [Pisolithus thermaeus]
MLHRVIFCIPTVGLVYVAPRVRTPPCSNSTYGIQRCCCPDGPSDPFSHCKSPSPWTDGKSHNSWKKNAESEEASHSLPPINIHICLLLATLRMVLMMISASALCQWSVLRRRLRR